MTEALPVIIMGLLFTVPWFIKKQWVWGFVFLTLMAVVGAWEGIMYWLYDKTISQIFWDFSMEHPKSAIGIGVCITIAYIILLVHLFWKIGKKENA